MYESLESIRPRVYFGQLCRYRTYRIDCSAMSSRAGDANKTDGFFFFFHKRIFTIYASMRNKRIRQHYIGMKKKTRLDARE